MKVSNRKWWLAVAALLCLVPATTFAGPRKEPVNHSQRPVRRQRLPEGGSSLAYVLGAGVTCLGAMLVRSRIAKAKQS